MTIQLFLMMFTVGAALSMALTQALKKAVSQKFSSNLLNLLVSLAVGAGGSSIYYYMTDISFTGKNVVWILLLVVALWGGSMNGYDKVKQLIEQIRSWMGKNNGTSI